MALLVSSKRGSSREKVEMPEVRLTGARLKRLDNGPMGYEISFSSLDGERYYELRVTTNEAFDIFSDILGLDKRKFRTFLEHLKPEDKP